MTGLDFTLSRQGDALTVVLRGGLNGPNASELAAAQDKELAAPEVKNVVWDVGGLTLMASAGLRVIMAGIKICMERGGSFTLAAPNANIRQIIRISGLGQYLTVSDTPA